MTTDLPIVGAALRLRELPQYIDWLVAHQRDLEIQDPGYTDYLDTDWHAEAEAGRKLLTERGYTGRMGIHAAYDGLDLFSRDKKVQEVIQTRYLQSLAFATELGATHMVIHSPFVTFGNAYAPFPPHVRQGIIGIVHSILEPVLTVAVEMKCTLVIECILDKNPQHLIELVRSFNSDYVRLSVDTGHAFIMHQSGGASPGQWIIEAGDLLGHVHLQDTDGDADHHWAIGDGNINWSAVFRALHFTNAKPRLCIEVAEVMRSAQWLEQHGLAR